MGKGVKENKVEVQKGKSIDPNMKTMKTMNQEEKLVEKHQQNESWKSAGTLKAHMPKK